MTDIESVYTMIFFYNRYDALYTDPMPVVLGDWNIIFKYRFLRVAVCHVDTQKIIFFIYFQVDITGIRRFHLAQAWMAFSRAFARRLHRSGI